MVVGVVTPGELSLLWNLKIASTAVLYRLVLKPFLGKMLETGSLGLNQLDIQFLEGTVELRVLLRSWDTS